MCSAELLVLEQPIEPTASQLVSPLELHAFQKDRPGFLPHPRWFSMCQPVLGQGSCRHFCPRGHLGIGGIHITYSLSFLFALVSSAFGSENGSLVETVADSLLGPS